jgi:uncharacterized RDD family membrane protein YckC
MDSNPYASPSADEVSSDEAALHYQEAGKEKRFLNYLIDTFVTGFGIAWAIGRLSPSALQWYDQLSPLQSVGLSYLFSLIYYPAMEGTSGTTLGKLLTGTRVEDEDRGPASFPQILRRTFARCIPFAPFSFLGSRSDRGWHDTLSRTRVIDLRAPRISIRRTIYPLLPPGSAPRPDTV